MLNINWNRDTLFSELTANESGELVLLVFTNSVRDTLGSFISFYITNRTSPLFLSVSGVSFAGVLTESNIPQVITVLRLFGTQLSLLDFSNNQLTTEQLYYILPAISTLELTTVTHISFKNNNLNQTDYSLLISTLHKYTYYKNIIELNIEDNVGITGLIENGRIENTIHSIPIIE
jgi:hypothetical protein